MLLSNAAASSNLEAEPLLAAFGLADHDELSKFWSLMSERLGSEHQPACAQILQALKSEFMCLTIGSMRNLTHDEFLSVLQACQRTKWIGSIEYYLGCRFRRSGMANNMPDPCTPAEALRAAEGGRQAPAPADEENPAGVPPHTDGKLNIAEMCDVLQITPPAEALARWNPEDFGNHSRFRNLLSLTNSAGPSIVEELDREARRVASLLPFQPSQLNDPPLLLLPPHQSMLPPEPILPLPTHLPRLLPPPPTQRYAAAELADPAATAATGRGGHAQQPAPCATTACADLAPEDHQWLTFGRRNKKETGVAKEEKHTCGYCGKSAYGFCAGCFPIGVTPAFAVCGAGRDCFQQHCDGVWPRHSMLKRKRKAGGALRPLKQTHQASQLPTEPAAPDCVQPENTTQMKDGVPSHNDALFRPLTIPVDWR